MLTAVMLGGHCVKFLSVLACRHALTHLSLLVYEDKLVLKGTLKKHPVVKHIQ